MADPTDVEMTQPSEVEPKDSDWVRLETTDGFTYLVKRKVALASGTMRNMLDPTSGYTEAKTRICSMKERGIITEKLVEYMCFKSHYESAASKEDIPANEFMERVPPEGREGYVAEWVSRVRIQPWLIQPRSPTENLWNRFCVMLDLDHLKTQAERRFHRRMRKDIDHVRSALGSMKRVEEYEITSE